MSSPVSFYTPDVMAGSPVSQGTRFELHDSDAAAIAAWLRDNGLEPGEVACVAHRGDQQVPGGVRKPVQEHEGYGGPQRP